MFDGPTPLPTTRFRVHTDDPTFHVAWRGGSRFVLSGEVSADPSSALELDTPSQHLAIDLAKKSTPVHAVALLRRALPRDIVMTHQRAEEGTQVTFHEAVVPAARPPRLRIFSTDAVQRVRQLRDNCVEFTGAAGGDTSLTILCDSRRATILISSGSSAQATALRVGAHVPHGFRALVDGPTVSVWKDADFFEQVA
ncbi:MAG: hypothetical protein IT380_14370 [Myxococcales bacterium]|nr:hypothetical protein [Myxococcales bacterium]